MVYQAEQTSTPECAPRTLFFYIAILHLILFSINLVVLSGAGERNLPVIALLFFECLLPLFLVKYSQLKDLLWVGFIGLFCFSYFSEYSNFYMYSDYSFAYSFLYTILYVNSFWVLQLIVRSNVLSIKEYAKVLRVIIISYFFVICLQQVERLTGLPVGINLNIRENLNTEWTWSVNGWMTEKSHSARIVFLCAYSYFCMHKIMDNTDSILSCIKKDLRIFWMFVYCMLTTGSVTAILLLGFFALTLLNWKFGLLIAAVFLCAGIILYNMEVAAMIRVVRFVPALFSWDMDAMMAADHSASVRFMPTLLYFDNIANMDWYAILFGYGSGYSRDFYYKTMIGVDSDNWSGGMLSSFLLDYGWGSSIMLLIIARAFCFRKGKIFDIVIFAVFYMAISINVPLFWIMLAMLSINKYFEETVGADGEDKMFKDESPEALSGGGLC